MEEFTRIRHELHTVTHHTHLLQTRLPVEEHVAERELEQLPAYMTITTLTLHPSNVARQSSRTARTHLRAYCTEGQYARRCPSRHIERQDMLLVHCGRAPEGMRCCRE